MLPLPLPKKVFFNLAIYFFYPSLQQTEILSAQYPNLNFHSLQLNVLPAFCIYPFQLSSHILPESVGIYRISDNEEISLSEIELKCNSGKLA